MPAISIVNPNGAFGSPVVGPGLLNDGAVYVELVAAVNINAGQTVAFNASRQAILGTVAATIGVSIDTVLAGQVVRVVTHGLILGLMLAPAGGVTSGGVLAAAAAGAISATPSVTIGGNIGIAVTTAAVGVAYDIFVSKM